VGRDDASGEPRMRVAADEAKNALLIEASPADYKRLMRVIGTLDVMPNQVLLEATIAEITLNDQLKFGLRWTLQSKNASYTFTDDVAGAVSSVFPDFSYALRASNIAASLNALNQITDVNVISSPSLTVMDNRTAFLQVGDQVPITTQSAAVYNRRSSTPPCSWCWRSPRSASWSAAWCRASRRFSPKAANRCRPASVSWWPSSRAGSRSLQSSQH
jgi:type II secretory pathway component GspD/PulD (secretin)